MNNFNFWNYLFIKILRSRKHSCNVSILQNIKLNFKKSKFLFCNRTYAGLEQKNYKFFEYSAINSNKKLTVS